MPLLLVSMDRIWLFLCRLLRIGLRLLHRTYSYDDCIGHLAIAIGVFTLHCIALHRVVLCFYVFSVPCFHVLLAAISLG